MIKLLISLVFLLLVGFAGVMMVRYDFPITAQMQGYLVETSAARLGIILIFALTIIYGFLKLIFWLKNSPKRLRARFKKHSEDEGYRNIMLGFSAIASGNTVKAHKFAAKAEKALPKQPLVKLLQAQVAVYSNNQAEAAVYYKELTETEEGSFIGFRGLISQAMSNNEPERAIEIADDLLRNNPKSAWLNEALIDLAFRTSEWDRLDRYLKKAEANKSVPREKLNDKFAVYYFLKGKIAHDEGRDEDAIWFGQRSLKYKPDFLPAALFLSTVYIEEEEYKKAKKLIDNFWPISPHPIFMKNYEQALLNRGVREKSKKVKDLYESDVNDVESAIFYARTLIAEHKNQEAIEIISAGLKLRETKTLCNLMSEVDDRIAWQNKAETALEDKSWYCKITGGRYADWQPYSDSGELDTIVWGFPPEGHKSPLSENNFLFMK